MINPITLSCGCVTSQPCSKHTPDSRPRAELLSFPFPSNVPADKAGVRLIPELTTRPEGVVQTRPKVYPSQKACGECGQSIPAGEACLHGATRYESPGRHTLCDSELGYLHDLVNAEHCDILIRRRTVIKTMPEGKARTAALEHMDMHEARARLLLAKIKHMTAHDAHAAGAQVTK